MWKLFVLCKYTIDIIINCLCRIIFFISWWPRFLMSLWQCGDSLISFLTGDDIVRLILFHWRWGTLWIFSLVKYSDQVKMANILQTLLKFRLWFNTWLQWIGQKQLQDETRNIEVFAFGGLILEVWWQSALVQVMMAPSQWNFDWNSNIFINENAFQNVRKLAAILSQPQCVKQTVVCDLRHL